MTPQEKKWLELKEQERNIIKERRELEAEMVTLPLEKVSMRKNVRRTWNQTELEDIARTTNVPMFDYFDTVFEPRTQAIKLCMENHPEHWEHLRKALKITESKPTFVEKK